jgi:uncharacterized membrane protein YuzA (DUF378 family)
MANVLDDNSVNEEPSGRGGRGPMVTAMKVAHALIGICGTALVVLGLGFWLGHGLNLIPLHEQLGIFIVLLLWLLAGIGLARGANRGRIAIAVVWGFIVIAFGFTQTGMLVGDMHWIIRVLHLLVGIAALWQAGAIAKEITIRSTAARV